MQLRPGRGSVKGWQKSLRGFGRTMPQGADGLDGSEYPNSPFRGIEPSRKKAWFLIALKETMRKSSRKEGNLLPQNRGSKRQSGKS